MTPFRRPVRSSLLRHALVTGIGCALALLAPSAAEGQTLSMSANAPTQVTAGETMLYTVTLTASGGNLTGVTVAPSGGELPRDVTFLSDDLGACVATDPDLDFRQNLLCTVGGIASGESLTFRLNLLVEADFVARTAAAYSQTFVADSDQTGPAEDSDTTFVGELADLQIATFTSDPGPVYAGQEFTYTIIVDNYGPSSARNVVITDTLVTSDWVDANGCSLAVRTEGGAIGLFNCNFATSTGVFDLGTMSSNWLNPRGAPCDDPDCTDSGTDMGRIIITINLELAAARATISTLATVQSETPDPVAANNSDETITEIEAVADLGVEKVAGTPTVVPGETASWTVTATNHGPSTAVNALLFDTLPAGLEPGSVEVSGTLFDETHAVVIAELGCTAGTPGDPADPAVCDLSNMEADWYAVVTVSGTVDPDHFEGSVGAIELRNDVEVSSETFDGAFLTSCDELPPTQPCPPEPDVPNFDHATVTVDSGRDFFTELFPLGGLDLADTRLELVPDGSMSFYSACASPTVPPWALTGSPLPLDDDDAVAIPVAGGEKLLLYGQKYGQLYVGSNGYLTFGGADSQHVPTAQTHFLMPRIAALFADLDPTAGGSVWTSQQSDRVVVMWRQVPLFNDGGTVTVLADLFFDGRIHLTFGDVAGSQALVGISQGTGIPDLFIESDLSAYPLCPTFFADSFESANVSRWSWFVP